MIMSFGSSQRKFPHCTCGHWLTHQTYHSVFYFVFFKLCILLGGRPKRKDRHPSSRPGSALRGYVLEAGGRNHKTDLCSLMLLFLCWPSYYRQQDAQSIHPSPTDTSPEMYWCILDLPLLLYVFPYKAYKIDFVFPKADAQNSLYAHVAMLRFAIIVKLPGGLKKTLTGKMLTAKITLVHYPPF